MLKPSKQSENKLPYLCATFAQGCENHAQTRDTNKPKPFSKRKKSRHPTHNLDCASHCTIPSGTTQILIHSNTPSNNRRTDKEITKYSMLLNELYPIPPTLLLFPDNQDPNTDIQRECMPTGKSITFTHHILRCTREILRSTHRLMTRLDRGRIKSTWRRTFFGRSNFSIEVERFGSNRTFFQQTNKTKHLPLKNFKDR